jgi:hypothetical protein
MRERKENRKMGEGDMALMCPCHAWPANTFQEHKVKQGGDRGEKLGHVKFYIGMAGFKSLGMIKIYGNLPKWTMHAGWV